MTIVNLTAHRVMSRWGETENWMGRGWAVVPPELEEAALTSDGLLELTVDQRGNVTDLVPLPRPAPPDPEPTLEERLRADVDYLAVMMGVEL